MFQVLYDKFSKLLGKERIKLNEPMSNHTTVKIGGPVDLFFTPQSTEELILGLNLFLEHEIPIHMIGWGANTLVSDKGIRGVVIKNLSQEIKIEGCDYLSDNSQVDGDKFIESRWEPFDEDNVQSLYDFRDLDYSENDCKRVIVSFDSGVGLPYAINHTIQNGITGLQWYSRIPGTIGGAIVNNIHGGTHLIAEVVHSVDVIDEKGQKLTLYSNNLKFGYDYSVFHEKKMFILNAKLALYRGDTTRAKYVAMEWAKRKSIQPSNSLGCVFKNLTEDEKKALNLPTCSFGYVVEHVLNLSGFRVGDAMVSMKHKAFIENVGKASASDYLAVMSKLREESKRKLGLDIKPEIFFLGEFGDEINEFLN